GATSARTSSARSPASPPGGPSRSRPGAPSARRDATSTGNAPAPALRRCPRPPPRRRSPPSPIGRHRQSAGSTPRCARRTLSSCRCSHSWEPPRMHDTTTKDMLTDLGRRLAGGSLSDAAIQEATERTPHFAILPWVNVVKIGGQSIMDRGAAAVRPVVDEIVANLKRHKMILGTGAGTRARHVYSLAIDLGLPTGVLTVLGTAVAWQNAQLLQYLLAQHGIAFIEPEGFASLPHYLMERGAVICQGMPPYKLWEHNPATGRIPPERTDTGCFLIAEVFGARKMIYVKDEDGLYTADPKKD